MSFIRFAASYLYVTISKYSKLGNKELFGHPKIVP